MILSLFNQHLVLCHLPDDTHVLKTPDNPVIKGWTCCKCRTNEGKIRIDRIYFPGFDGTIKRRHIYTSTGCINSGDYPTAKLFSQKAVGELCPGCEELRGLYKINMAKIVL